MQLPTLASALLLQQKEALMLEKAIRVRKALESRTVATMEEAFGKRERAGHARWDSVTENLGFSRLVRDLEAALDKKLREPVLKLAPTRMLEDSIENTLSSAVMRRNTKLEAQHRETTLQVNTIDANSLKETHIKAIQHQPTHFDHLMANPTGAGLSLANADNLDSDHYMSALPAHSSYSHHSTQQRLYTRRAMNAKKRSENGEGSTPRWWRQVEEAGQSKLWNDRRRDQELQMITQYVRENGLPYTAESLFRIAMIRPLFAVRYGTVDALSAQWNLLRNSTVVANKLLHKLQRLQHALRSGKATREQVMQQASQEDPEDDSVSAGQSMENGTADVYALDVNFDPLQVMNSLPEFAFWEQCLQESQLENQSVMNISAFAHTFSTDRRSNRDDPADKYAAMHRLRRYQIRLRMRIRPSSAASIPSCKDRVLRSWK